MSLDNAAQIVAILSAILAGSYGVARFGQWVFDLWLARRETAMRHATRNQMMDVYRLIDDFDKRLTRIEYRMDIKNGGGCP